MQSLHRGFLKSRPSGSRNRYEIIRRNDVVIAFNIISNKFNIFCNN